MTPNMPPVTSITLVPARSVSEPSPEKARDEPLLDQVRQG